MVWEDGMMRAVYGALSSRRNICRSTSPLKVDLLFTQSSYFYMCCLYRIRSLFPFNTYTLDDILPAYRICPSVLSSKCCTLDRTSYLLGIHSDIYIVFKVPSLSLRHQASDSHRSHFLMTIMKYN